jgi:hypothetical protein
MAESKEVEELFCFPGYCSSDSLIPIKNGEATPTNTIIGYINRKKVRFVDGVIEATVALLIHTRLGNLAGDRASFPRSSVSNFPQNLDFDHMRLQIYSDAHDLVPLQLRFKLKHLTSCFTGV